jgi:hypothetical protein
VLGNARCLLFSTGTVTKFLDYEICKCRKEQRMTDHDGKRLGPASRQKGKGAGVGAMTDLQQDLVPENMVLSNRDKTQHSGERGQDSKWVQTEQLEDHAANREPD